MKHHQTNCLLTTTELRDILLGFLLTSLFNDIKGVLGVLGFHFACQALYLLLS